MCLLKKSITFPDKKPWRMGGSMINLDVVSKFEIEKFYSKVTSKPKDENKLLFLMFAKAIVAKSKGIHVNWATYATHVHAFKGLIKIVKEES